MNLFAEAIAWIFSPERLSDINPLPELIGQHLYYTLISVFIACVIAIPIGYYIGHTGKGRELAVGISGAARAVPSFGLILLLVILIGVTAKTEAAIIAFVLLAIPSVLAGAYAGIESIDPQVIDAAKATGMTQWQILWKVEIPLGSLLLLGGIRSAILQVVATVVLAAYIGLGSLGLPILQGLALRRFDEMLGAAIIIVVIAIVLDLLLALAQKLLVPRGVISARGKSIYSAASQAKG